MTRAMASTPGTTPSNGVHTRYGGEHPRRDSYRLAPRPKSAAPMSTAMFPWGCWFSYMS
jgi:hypothetical protein